MIICIVLGVVGLSMGSFAGATVWRLRARQLVEDKSDGEKIDELEYKKLSPLTKVTFTSDRSRCLHCGHQLNWYDLLPLVSWMATRGKCRYCHQKIGWFEPLMELGVAAFFVTSYLLWADPLHSLETITHFILWLISGVLLAILFAYDTKWFLLPNRVTFPLIGVSALAALLQIMGAADMMAAFIDTVIAVGILSGIYLLLWLVSKGQWIGFGDVKLGLALAFLLADWQLAFIALFAANLIGCLLVIPGMLSGKITRGTRVPFGPLLIAGGVIAFLVGHPITEWYMAALVTF